LNCSPFTFDTIFHPDEGREDKINVALSGWRLFGIGAGYDPEGEEMQGFKNYLTSPPNELKSLAWPSPNGAPIHGAFFCRPGIKGSEHTLRIRKTALVDEEGNRRINPPLCAGKCHLNSYQTKEAAPGLRYHFPTLLLSLNLQRFLRHQARDDDPLKPRTATILRRDDERWFHGDEFSFDGADNWLPATPAWKRLREGDHLGKYIELVETTFGAQLDRAYNVMDLQQPWDRLVEDFHLETVETIWEFPSDNPIDDVVKFGARLMAAARKGCKVEMHDFKSAKSDGDPNHAKVEQIVNSPCITIPLAADVRLRLYAKTNKRIRFEIVQSSLRKKADELYKEAHFTKSQHARSSLTIPLLIGALRQRAAKHLNELVTAARKSDSPPVLSASVLNLLIQTSDAVRLFTYGGATHLEDTRSLLMMFCFFRGYRGTAKTGPMALAIAKLKERGVLVFDQAGQYYALADEYLPAVQALMSAAGEPLVAILGLEKDRYQFSAEGKPIGRIRDED
jgi:hypothetical protein